MAAAHCCSGAADPPAASVCLGCAAAAAGLFQVPQLADLLHAAAPIAFEGPSGLTAMMLLAYALLQAVAVAADGPKAV